MQWLQTHDYDSRDRRPDERPPIPFHLGKGRARRPRRGSAAAGRATAPEPRGGLRILLVEDEMIIALDVERILSELGHEVCAVATSAQDAVQQAARHRPDLVFMDVRLEGPSDGIEAAGAIRERFGAPSIFLTAHADPSTVQRAGAVEPLGFLIKPYSRAQIEAALDHARKRLFPTG